MPSREFSYKGKDVEVAEFTQLEDEAGAVVWDCALVMCHYLLHQQQAGNTLLRGKAVVEVGAGTGVVGIVAAALCEAQQVVLTDLPHLLPWLDKNLQANAAVLGGHARVMPLTWGKQADAHNVLSSLHASTNSGSSTSSTPSSSTPAADASAMHTCSNGSDVIPATVYAQQQAIAAAAVTADLNSPAHLPDNAINGASTDASIPLQPPASCSSPPAADFIIASDVTYEAVQFKALVQSLVDLSGPYTQVLLGFEERPGARDFVQLCVKHGFSVQKIAMTDMHPDWHAEEIHLFVLKQTATTQRPL